jgi:triacylglycerol esterase/lipase EstA (alpha/beta hydrolase family)
MEAPSKLLLGLEAIRGVCEYGLGWVANLPLLHISPRGDGHPVIVFPGLGTADGSTHFIRTFLEELGYVPYSWGLGRNYGPREGMDILLEQLTTRVQEIYELHGGQKVSLIGWSLGGIYSREIAKQCPDMIRQVITLGTPFKEMEVATNAVRLYEFLSGDKGHSTQELKEQLEIRPPVPYTSIYSKTDGVVNWESSIEELTDISENVEIPGASHLGLGHNPIAMYVIANRLSQPPDSWKPFKM